MLKRIVLTSCNNKNNQYVAWLTSQHVVMQVEQDQFGQLSNMNRNDT